MVSYLGMLLAKLFVVNVLILIVVEDGLVHYQRVGNVTTPVHVLILIVVEDGLVL